MVAKVHKKVYKRYPVKFMRELDRRFREGEIRYRVESVGRSTTVTWWKV